MQGNQNGSSEKHNSYTSRGVPMGTIRKKGKFMKFAESPLKNIKQKLKNHQKHGHKSTANGTPTDSTYGMFGGGSVNRKLNPFEPKNNRLGT